MITVHHLENSQSFRIVWLLEELCMDYELKLYKRNADDHMAPPEYKAKSPMGTAPMITITMEGGEQEKDVDEKNEDEKDDDNAEDEGNEKKESDDKCDNNTITLCESNAIIEYILDLEESKTEGKKDDFLSKLRPRATDNLEDRRKFLFWFHGAQGSLQPLMMVDALFRIVPKSVPWPLSTTFNVIVNKVKEKFIKPRMESILSLAEEQFTEQEKENDNDNDESSTKYYLAGSHFSVADISSIYTFESAFTRYPELFNKYPKCQEWLDQMYERPRFQVAQKKVGETYVVFSLEKHNNNKGKQDDDDDED